MRRFSTATAVGLAIAASSWSHGSTGLDEPFLNERLRVSVRPPLGWHLAKEGLYGVEPVEFWKSDEYGPRIQVFSLPFELGEPSNVEETQKELARALLRQFPDLKMVDEKKLTHQGSPAIEVMATLELGDTFYHVIQRCLFAEGRLFIITCASFESTFIYDLPLFRATMDSVRVLEPIYGSDRALGATRHLLSPSTLGWLALGCLLSGLAMRQISNARLKRMRH